MCVLYGYCVWYCIWVLYMDLCMGIVYGYCIWVLCMSVVCGYCIWILCMSVVYWYCVWVLCMDIVNIFCGVFSGEWVCFRCVYVCGRICVSYLRGIRVELFRVVL